MMLHSLESCNDLRLEESNHLRFRHEGNKLILSVQEQFEDSELETFFEDIYKICL